MNAMPPADPALARVASLRARMWDAGLRPVAIYNIDAPTASPAQCGKAPKGNGWQLQARLDTPHAVQHPPEPDALNTGLLADGLRLIDVDVDDATVAGRVKALALALLGDAPIRWRANSGRVLLPYRAAEGEPGKLVVAGTTGKLEVLGKGQQAVVDGLHPTGATIQWEPDPPGAFTRDGLVAVTEAQVGAFLAAAGPLIGAEQAAAAGPSTLGQLLRAPSVHGPSADPIDVAAALTVIPNEGPANWEFWNKVGLATHAATGGSTSGFAAWCGWSERHPQHDSAACTERWQHYTTSPPTRSGAGTLFHLAREARPDWRRPSDARSAEPRRRERKAEQKQPSALDVSNPQPAQRPAAVPPHPENTDTRPLIQIAAGQLDRLATRAEAVLRKSGKPVFQRGSMLVRPVAMEVPASRGRMTVSAGLTALTPPAMLDLYSQVARWERFDKRSEEWVAADPPGLVAAVHLSRVGQWRLPPVAGVITTPTLRPDGSILTAPGYDAQTRLYHVPDPTLRLRMPAREATRADAERALATLEHLLAAFPFVSDVDRSVALSMLLTPVARGAMSVAPLHAAKASTAGTGKSYLVDLASAIATGRPCPVAAAAETAEETEKRLVGLLLSAFPIVSLDNVNGELGGDVLCQAVERPLIRVRPLGRSDIIEIESRACIFATGNALRVRGDMVRRSLVCALDANMERPELRQFAADPVAEVVENRGLYVGACLTIVRAYLAAGCPDLLPPLASFEDWSGTVRSALVWLGKADPCQSMEAAREDDPELSEMREVLTLWVQQFGAEGRTARDAAEEASARAPTQMGEPTDFAAPELRDALLRIAGDRGIINTRRLGKWLLDHEGRIVGGMRIKRDGAAQGGLVRWAVRPA